MSKYIAKSMYIEKPQRLVIWNGGSNTHVRVATLTNDHEANSSTKY
jgi:hypothetical protein